MRALCSMPVRPPVAVGVNIDRMGLIIANDMDRSEEGAQERITERAAEKATEARVERTERQIEEKSGIQIRFRQLEEGVHPLHITRSVEELDIPALDGGGGKLEITGAVTRKVDRLIFDLHLAAEGRFECTRCLEPFEREIETELHTEFNPPFLGQIDDGITHTYDPTAKPYVDIFEDVRDAVALAIPMRMLCKEDCKGICAGCGHDLNREACTCPKAEEIGPWAALKAVGERLRADESDRIG